MTSIEEVTETDFEETYPLLQQLNDNTLAKEDWSKVFTDLFSSGAHRGYKLKVDNSIVGFFGVIFSERKFKEKSYRFANTHSWIVAKDHRSKGLMLLNKIHKLDDYVLTNFSASSGPFEIMKKLGWEEIDYSLSYTLASPIRRVLSDNKRVKSGEVLENLLEGNDLEIYRDHLPFPCHMNAITKSDSAGFSFQVFREIPYAPSVIGKLGIKSKPFKLGQLDYVSDPEILFGEFEKNLHSICRSEGWMGMIIPDRYLNRHKISGFKPYYKKRPVLVRNRGDLAPEMIDFLYSEVMALNLT